MVMSFLEDLRASARSLRRRPGLTATAMMVLGLGLGAVITVFGVIDAFLFRALPFPNADQLVWIQSRSEGSLLGVSHPDYLDWKSAPGIFEDLAQLNAREHVVLGFGDRAESLLATRTTSNLFSLLGVRPVIGRLLTVAEDQPDAGQSVLLSYAVWARGFGADPTVLEKRVTVDGAPYTVVGVMPPDFGFPERSDLWIPSSAWADQWPHRQIRIDSVVGRLKSGISFEQARSALETVSLRLEKEHSETNTGISAEVLPLREVWTGENRIGLILLFGACGVLLLLACANITNLLLVWASSRDKETAIRQALGAGPGRQLRLIILESVLLGLAGGALGVLLASWGIQLVERLLPDRLPSWINLRIDLRIAIFALAASLLAGLAASLMPALRALGTQPQELLREGSRTASRRQSLWARRGLMVSQIAMSLLLLISAGLVAKSFIRLRSVDPGFSPRHVLTLRIDLPVFTLQSLEQVLDLYHGILERTAAIPGVRSVGATTSLPLSGTDTWNLWEFTLLGQGESEQKRNPRVHGHVVTSGYFASLGIPLREGRTFEVQDGFPVTLGAIVSRSFAERFWPGRKALGQRLNLGGPADGAPVATVVGVAEDVRHESLTKRTGLDLYFPLDHLPSWPLHLVIRTDRNPSALVSAVRGRIREVSGDLGVRNVILLSDHVDRSLWRPRIWATLFSVFSGIALVLATAGVYGVVSTLVSQRSREIGIRMALGAGRPEIARVILGEVAQLALAGIGLGLMGALIAGRFLSALLFDVTAWDESVLATSALAVALITLAASLSPLFHALRVDPAVTLRLE